MGPTSSLNQPSGAASNATSCLGWQLVFRQSWVPGMQDQVEVSVYSGRPGHAPEALRDSPNCLDQKNNSMLHQEADASPSVCPLLTPHTSSACMHMHVTDCQACMLATHKDQYTYVSPDVLEVCLEVGPSGGQLLLAACWIKIDLNTCFGARCCQGLKCCEHPDTLDTQQ